MKTFVRIGVVTVLALSVLAGPVLAQAKPLTEEELAQGWIQLFDGETLFGWTQLGAGNWRVEEGNIVVDGWSNGWIATTSAFTNCELVVKLRVSPEGGASVSVQPHLEKNAHELDANAVAVVARTEKDQKPEWRTVRIVLEKDSAKMSIDDKSPANIPVLSTPRYVGIQTFGKGTTLEISEVKLRPLGLESIFNGKDLTGWNIIPDHKSVFSVVDGAMRIENGNGQIETDAVYKDFVLQLDVVAYGNSNPEKKPLNSGVFFRSPKGVFWKGYESQLRNEWTDDDRTKPHDFGTGGIYALQPTRKVIPNEGDWFHKTIVVHGNHMATWVNGYQTADYTDVRPPVTNGDGKAGLVMEPGTITLQGHDPTTKLDFKNINISAYPEK